MKVASMILIAVLVVTPGTFAIAQTTKADGAGETKKAAAHAATGVVKSVDRAKGTVMLAHDPVKSLNWPAMTMPFAVKDQKLFDKLQPGGKVQFEFVQQGKDYVISTVK